uniref:SH3 domain-containing protein n=1 Tax=Mycena chlorophos TaxID=658473 RepID=A0ABQ0LD12_MYCCL|nr:predicted protein [Mycena chlorophos]
MPKSHRNRLGPQHLRRQARRRTYASGLDDSEPLGRGLVGTVAGLPVVTEVATALKGGGGATTTATRTSTSSTTPTTTSPTATTKAGSQTEQETEGASPTTGSESSSGPGNDSDTSIANTDSPSRTSSKDKPTASTAIDFVSAPPTGTGTTSTASASPTAFVVLGSSTVPVIGSGAASATSTNPVGLAPSSTSSNGTTLSDSQNTSKSTNSGGFAALGIILAFTVCAFVVLYARRRAKHAGQPTWWAATLRQNRSLSEKSTATGSSDLRVSGTDEATMDTKSIRSSFGTSFDHSIIWLVDDRTAGASAKPEIPPMAQIRDGPTGRLSLRVSEPGPSAGNAYTTPGPLSPISVDSTFSLVSTIAFAGASSSPIPTCPPLVDVGTDAHGGYYADAGASRRTSAASSLYSTTSFEANTAAPGAGGNAENPNPFSDTFASSTDTSTLKTQTQTQTSTLYRPFDATRPDELSPRAGNQVRVVEVYDDGWAMVEKLPPAVAGVGFDKNQEQGLIPVDCLRADEGVQVYLEGSGNRVSGGGGGGGDGSTRTRTIV